MGIADDPGDAGESGKFFRSTLGVAACDNEADGGVGGVELSNGFAGLSIGGGSDGAGVEDDDIGGCGRGGGGAAAIQQLALEGGAIGLGGAAAELFDKESRHLEPQMAYRFSQPRVRREDSMCNNSELKHWRSKLRHYKE